jgi:hypothetical protein
LPGPPSAFVDNTARLKYYASDAAQATDPLYNYASNQSSPGPNVRKARVGLANPLAITKAITGSSVAGTAGSNVNAGETLDFTVVVTLAEGRHDSFQLADSLAALPADWNCSTPASLRQRHRRRGHRAEDRDRAATTGTSVGTITWTYTSAQLTRRQQHGERHRSRARRAGDRHAVVDAGQPCRRSARLQPDHRRCRRP